MSFKPKNPHEAVVTPLSEGASVTAVKGNLGYINSSGYAVECVADPPVVDFVFAENGHNSTNNGDSDVRVWTIRPGVEFTARSNTTTAAAHVGGWYGVSLADSRWYVDISDTSNIRVQVTGLDPRSVGVEGGGYILEFGSTIAATTLVGDLYTDRWLDSDNNTFVGVGTAGSGNLTHETASDGWYNTFFGANTGHATTTGSSNTFVGRYAGSNNTTGSLNRFFGLNACLYQNDGESALETPENSIYIGALAKSGSNPVAGEDAITNEVAIGYNVTGNGANTVTLGNGSVSELHCKVALTVDSDKRIKRDIAPAGIGLSFIEKLSPVTFKPVNPADYPEQIRPSLDARPDDDDVVYLGLIAQEVESVLSAQGIDANIVATSSLGEKSITYSALIMPLISAVKELSGRVAELEAK